MLARRALGSVDPADGFDRVGCDRLVSDRVVETVALTIRRFQRGIIDLGVALVLPEREAGVENVPGPACELGDGREDRVCVRVEGRCRAAELDDCHDY